MSIYRQVFHLKVKVLKQTKLMNQTLITVSLICSPVCSSAVIGCTYDLPSGICNMYVYDIEEEGRLSDDWAISSTNITITATYSSFEMTFPELYYAFMVIAIIRMYDPSK